MENLLYKIIAYLDRTPDLLKEVKLQDDGQGAYIKEWNVDGVAKPTDSQLNALASDATKLKNNEIIKDTRKAAYGDIGEELDEIYKDFDAWKARIKKIKDDNPKE